MELKVKARIEKDIREDGERKLHAAIQQKLEELHVQEGVGQGTVASSTAAASILPLEAAQNEISQKQATVAAYRDVFCTRASNVVQMFADTEFLHTSLSFLEYHQFS